MSHMHVYKYTACTFLCTRVCINSHGYKYTNSCARPPTSHTTMCAHTNACVHICVCMCANMYVRANYIDQRIKAPVCMLVCTYNLYAYTCICAYTCAHLCVHTLSPMCTLTCSHMCMNVHMCSHGHGVQDFRSPFIEAVDWVLISCWFSPLWQ